MFPDGASVRLFLVAGSLPGGGDATPKCIHNVTEAKIKVIEANYHNNKSNY